MMPVFMLTFVMIFMAVCVRAQSESSEAPLANPARPTVSTPATLTPVGYVQLETGYLAAWDSPEFSSQSNITEFAKIAVTPRVQLIAGWEPFAYSRVSGKHSVSPGGVALGFQALVYQGEGMRPAIAVSYFRQLYGGDAPDLDLGGPSNAATILLSGDYKGFHFDTNYFFNEVTNGEVRRAQFGQTLSVAHPLVGKFGLSGEIWHFTQPFLESRTVGNLWALNYSPRKNLVLDFGFSRGLTSTSTRWAVFVGFTYVIPHRISFH